MEFNVGDRIQIQCEVAPGAFPHECLVTFETIDGPVSGFVRKEFVSHGDKDERGYIDATVKSVSPTVITVLVTGSFFTTTGLASLNPDWASKHVQVAHAA